MMIDLSLAPLLQRVLKDAGFSFDSVRRVLGAGPGGLVDLSSGPLAMHRTRGEGTLEVLVRLLVLGAGVSAEMVERALGRELTSAGLKGGLLECSEGGEILSRLAGVPYGDMVVLADFSRRPLGPVEPARDHVMGIGRSTLVPTRLLEGAMKRQAGARLHTALDLGCGCGFLALWAGAWCDRVIGTDINPRAIELARFNALLNGRANVEIRQGSLTEPVHGETFDLIVSNPPFVISPESAIVYRDGAAQLSHVGVRRGDEFCERVVRDASRLLGEGGVLVTTLNWSEIGDENFGNWQGRLGGWAPEDCQAWVIRTDSQPVDAYAAMWIRHTMAGEPGWSEARYFERFDAWMRHYEMLGVERIAYGQMIVRRKSPAFTMFEDIDGRWIEGGAIDVVRALDGRENAAGLREPACWDDAAAWLAEKWKFASGTQVQEVSEIGRAGSVAVCMAGRPVCGPMHTELWRVLAGLTGRTSLGRTIEDGLAIGGIGGERKDEIAKLLWGLVREGALVRAAT